MAEVRWGPAETGCDGNEERRDDRGLWQEVRPARCYSSGRRLQIFSDWLLRERFRLKITDAASGESPHFGLDSE